MLDYRNTCVREGEGIHLYQRPHKIRENNPLTAALGRGGVKGGGGWGWGWVGMRVEEGGGSKRIWLYCAHMAPSLTFVYRKPWTWTLYGKRALFWKTTWTVSPTTVRMTGPNMPRCCSTSCAAGEGPKQGELHGRQGRERPEQRGGETAMQCHAVSLRQFNECLSRTV